MYLHEGYLKIPGNTGTSQGAEEISPVISAKLMDEEGEGEALVWFYTTSVQVLLLSL